MPKLSANRVVLLLHSVFIVATAAAIFVAAVSGSLPKTWQATVAAGVGILGAIAAATVAVTKFLDGSQKSEALQRAAALSPIYATSGGGTSATVAFTPVTFTTPEPDTSGLPAMPSQKSDPPVEVEPEATSPPPAPVTAPPAELTTLAAPGPVGSPADADTAAKLRAQLQGVGLTPQA